MLNGCNSGSLYQDADQPPRRRSGGCLALLKTILDVAEKTKDQLDKIRKREQTFIQYSPSTSETGKTTTEQITMSTNFPDYVTSYRGQIIFRFLSNLADHFKRNHFWIKGQYGLYAKKFRNVPESYLKQAFQDYLINELEWLPTIKQIVHYMTTQRNDFKTHWHTIPVNETYCQHCRTDEEGKEGGFREIYFYGFRQSLQKKAEAHYKGACDCELASKSNHAPYTEIVDWMRKQDNFAEIHVSFYDANTDRIVPAQEQSRHHWQKKIDDGIIYLDEHQRRIREYTGTASR